MTDRDRGSGRHTPGEDEAPGVAIPGRVFHAVRLWLSRALS